MKRLVARYPDDLMLASTSAELEKAMKAGKIAGMLGMEGGHSIGSSLAVLRQMYDLGARYMTLTHSQNLSWADASTDVPAHDGLTDFGRTVVREKIGRASCRERVCQSGVDSGGRRNINKKKQ